MAGVQNQVKNLLKQKSNQVLVDSLKMLDKAVANESDKSKAADYRVSRAWVADEIESRFPEANEALSEWVDNMGERSYFDVLIDVVSKSLSK